MTMCGVWQDKFRHRLVSLVNSKENNGRIAIDDLVVICRTTTQGRITTNLAYTTGDRRSILAQVADVLTSAEVFFVWRYNRIVVVGIQPEELPIFVGKGWVESKGAPLWALEAIKLIDRGSPKPT